MSEIAGHVYKTCSVCKACIVEVSRMTMCSIFQVKAARTVILVAEGCSIDMPELQVSKIKAGVHVVLNQQLTRYKRHGSQIHVIMTKLFFPSRQIIKQ